MRIKAKYEIEKIIKTQKTVSTEKLKELFKLYVDHIDGKHKWYKDRITKLEQTITNQRRELRRLRNH